MKRGGRQRQSPTSPDLRTSKPPLACHRHELLEGEALSDSCAGGRTCQRRRVARNPVRAVGLHARVITIGTSSLDVFIRRRREVLDFGLALPELDER